MPILTLMNPRLFKHQDIAQLLPLAERVKATRAGKLLYRASAHSLLKRRNSLPAAILTLEQGNCHIFFKTRDGAYVRRMTRVLLLF